MLRALSRLVAYDAGSYWYGLLIAPAKLRIYEDSLPTRARTRKGRSGESKYSGMRVGVTGGAGKGVTV